MKALTLTLRNSNQGGLSEPDETYAKSKLGNTQEVSSGEQKVLGVQWDIGADQLKFDFGDLQILQEIWSQRKGMLSVLLEDSTTRWGSYLQLQFCSRYSSRSSVCPSWTVISLLQGSC